MKEIKLHFHDYSYVYVDTSMALFAEIRDYFSYFVENYQMLPKFKYTTWDGKIKLIDNNTRLLPYGLVKVLVEYAKKNNYKISLESGVCEKFNISQDDFDSWINSRKYFSGTVEIYPYWYQLESVYESLKYKRRILNLPTSAGKSLIQALLTKYVIEHSDMNVLILVPSVNLVTQMKADLVDYRLFTEDEIAEVKAGSTQVNERVVVSTWQSAIKNPNKWFEQFGMLLCDEVHLAIGKSISSIVTKMNNCEYKIGLSGSLRDGKANIMQYVGLFGSVIAPTSTVELMREGQITELQINCIMLKYPQKVSIAMANAKYPDEIKFITNVSKRTKWICALAHKLSQKNENVFVMFKHIEHGKRIYDEMLVRGHTKVFYVSGDIKSDERDRIKKAAEDDSGVVIIASYGVFSTGISVKNLHHVIFAHPIKSKTTVLQTIGRVLRKHKTKSIAKLWDIIDDMSMVESINGKMCRSNINYAYNHAVDRIARYKSEGFEYIIKKVDIFS